MAAMVFAVMIPLGFRAILGGAAWPAVLHPGLAAAWRVAGDIASANRVPMPIDQAGSGSIILGADATVGEADADIPTVSGPACHRQTGEGKDCCEDRNFCFHGRPPFELCGFFLPGTTFPGLLHTQTRKGSVLFNCGNVSGSQEAEVGGGGDKMPWKARKTEISPSSPQRLRRRGKRWNIPNPRVDAEIAQTRPWGKSQIRNPGCLRGVGGSGFGGGGVIAG